MIDARHDAFDLAAEVGEVRGEDGRRDAAHPHDIQITKEAPNYRVETT